MKILLIGKLPPIQGGVAVETLCAARQLKRLGHSVVLLTNSEATPWHHRISFSPSDEVLFSKMLEGIETVNIGRLSNGNHIPFDQSFAIRLLARGMEIISEFKPEVIVGSYLFPYGYVAAQLARQFEVPFLFKHAGSDLGRLSKNLELHTLAKWVFNEADVVFSNVRSGSEGADDLNFLEVNANKIVRMPARRLPEYYFKAPDAKWDGEASIGTLLRNHATELPYDVVTFLSRQFSSVQDTSSSAFKIGLYGKIGATKGTFNLLRAVHELKSREINVVVKALISGVDKNWRKLCNAVVDSGLQENFQIYPSAAPWLIPDFVRSCDAIAFLEHEFPIKYHSPKLPREIIVAGGVAIMSNEVAKKQAFRGNLIHSENCILVDDPGNLEELCAAISLLAQDPEKVAAIRAQSRRLGDFIEWTLDDGDSFGDAVHEVLQANYSGDRQMAHAT